MMSNRAPGVIASARRRLWLLAGLSALHVLTGCGDQVRRPSAQEVTEFLAVEATGPSVDIERVLQARITPGPYRTSVGDVLQVEMPRMLNAQSTEGVASDGREACVCRIGDDGAIVLPMVGPFEAAGKTLAEIEAGVLARYYPKYIKTPFPIYVSVLEYDTRKVSIVGAVANPGVYALRPDQMSLVALLMEAGGIVEQGAAVIRIARSGGSVLPSDIPAGSPMGSAGGYEAGRLTAPRSRTAGGAEPACDRMALRARFEREGPLRATGWLVVAGPADVRVRKWLDLASEFQRSAFLRTVAGATGRAPDPRLDVRLVELARTLESFPPGQNVDTLIQSPEWRMTEDGCCVTFLDTQSMERPSGAGEIVPVNAARLGSEEAVETMVLPVRGLNIPFADVSLREGDSVIVERSHERFVSVLGLVRVPGNFPYPPEVEYNLAQAIGFAGGLDMVADPRYVSIYRLRPDGDIASLTVQLVDPQEEQDLTEVLAMPLKPGDVVSVEHTPRTRTNVFLDRIFRISLGLYFNPESIWNDE